MGKTPSTTSRALRPLKTFFLMYITKNIMESIPATIAITRPTAKKVKWAFRLKDEVSEEWSEWTPACSAEHLIVTMSEMHTRTATNRS